MKRIATVMVAMCALGFLSSCQDTALNYYNKGIDSFEAGDTALALEYFKKSVDKRDSDPDAHSNLAVAYYHAGEFEKARPSSWKPTMHWASC